MKDLYSNKIGWKIIRKKLYARELKFQSRFHWECWYNVGLGYSSADSRDLRIPYFCLSHFGTWLLRSRDLRLHDAMNNVKVTWPVIALWRRQCIIVTKVQHVTFLWHHNVQVMWPACDIIMLRSCDHSTKVMKCTTTMVVSNSIATCSYIELLVIYILTWFFCHIFTNIANFQNRPH